MRGKDLLYLINDLDDDIIIEAASDGREIGGKSVDLEEFQKVRKPILYIRKGVVIAAAIICLLVALSAIAIATNLFGLKNAIYSSTYVPTPSGNTKLETMISLQGYAGSNEYKAVQEWDDFLQSYDTDHSLLSAVGNRPTGLDKRYELYGSVYTQEMADKLVEITEKYGLSLHSEFIVLENEDAIMEKVANGNFIGETNTAYGGYMYEDGSFKFDGVIADKTKAFEGYFEGVIVEYDEKLVKPEDVFDRGDYEGKVTLIPTDNPGSSAKRNEDDLVGFSFMCLKMGTLTDIGLNIGDIKDYTEWSYKTASGVTVSLSQSSYLSLIMVKLEDAFITVSINEDSDNFSKSELEKFADTLDFTLLK